MRDGVAERQTKVQYGGTSVLSPQFRMTCRFVLQLTSTIPMVDRDQDLAKINQDRACVVYPFMGSETCALLCVYDGHGEGGDMVRRVLRAPSCE